MEKEKFVCLKSSQEDAAHTRQENATTHNMRNTFIIDLHWLWIYQVWNHKEFKMKPLHHRAQTGAY